MLADVQSAFSWLVFPLFVAAAVGGALGALSRGAPGEVVVGACLLVTIVFVAILSPFRWQQILASAGRPRKAA